MPVILAVWRDFAVSSQAQLISSGVAAQKDRMTMRVVVSFF